MGFAKLVRMLFTIALVGGFALWWQLDHVGLGHQPAPGFLRWWYGLEGQPEFDLLTGQLLFPLFWWVGRKWPWSSFWRTWSTVHLVAVGLLILVTLIMLLATPDIGGHWG
ncbi:MAG TPA: hypothetical protein VGE21_06250 [Flavobacteriales bacterium]